MNKSIFARLSYAGHGFDGKSNTVESVIKVTFIGL